MCMCNVRSVRAFCRPLFVQPILGLAEKSARVRLELRLAECDADPSCEARSWCPKLLLWETALLGWRGKNPPVFEGAMAGRKNPGVEARVAALRMGKSFPWVEWALAQVLGTLGQ